MAFWTSAVERVFPGARQIEEDFERGSVSFRMSASFAFTTNALAEQLTPFGRNVQITMRATRNGWDEPELDVRLDHVEWPPTPR